MDQPQTLPATRAMIGRWSVDRYTTLIKWWLVAGLVVSVGLTIWGEGRWPVIIAEIAITIIVGWLTATAGGGKTEGLAAGAMIGLPLGFGISLTKFIMTPTIYYGANMVVETMLTGFLGALLCVCAIITNNILKRPPS